MIQPNDNWRFFLRGLGVPGATCAVALVLLVMSIVYEHRLADEYSRMRFDHGTVNSEYEALVSRKRILERYHRRYEQFRAQGFVANERRLDWIEALREEGEHLKLPSLRFSLEPQVGRTISGVDDVRLRASRMELEIGLLHELDLLHFIAAVRSRAPGLVSVDRCALSRQGAEQILSAVESNILAVCSLSIFSAATSDVTTGIAAL
ncbi:MAG: hypothetical protein AAF417_17125 [Pseudomonadota bacterium]